MFNSLNWACVQCELSNLNNGSFDTFPLLPLLSLTLSMHCSLSSSVIVINLPVCTGVLLSSSLKLLFVSLPPCVTCVCTSIDGLPNLILLSSANGSNLESLVPFLIRIINSVLFCTIIGTLLSCAVTAISLTCRPDFFKL